MDSNPTEEEKKRIINELRNALLLALRCTRGENANLFQAEAYIRVGLDKLGKLEENIT